jgi:MFS family permease
MLVLLPAFAKGQTGVSEAAIGLIYAAMTVVIVSLQLAVTRWTRGHNRMAMLRAGALLWVLAWTVCLIAGAQLRGGSAAIVLGGAIVVYALGECLYTAIMLPTATKMAPDELRGRYLGLVGLAWQGGFLVGPSLGGLILGWFPLGLPAMCLLGCAAAALATATVDRRLAPAMRFNPVPAA